MPKIVIQNHKNAPELNNVFLLNRGKLMQYKSKGRLNECAGLKTIKDVRKKLFSPIEKPFIHATVEKVFPAPYEYLNSVKSGRVDSRKGVIDYIRADKEKNRYGEFIDMSHCDVLESYTMPTPAFIVKTRIVG